MNGRALARSLASVRSQTLLLSIVPLLFLLALLAVAVTLVQENERASMIGEDSSRIAARIDDVDRYFSLSNRAISTYQKTHQLADLRPVDRMTRELPGVVSALETDARIDPAIEAAARPFGDLTLQGRAVITRYVALERAGHPAEARALADAPSTKTLGVTLLTAKGALQRANNARARHEFGVQRRAIAAITRVLIALTVTAVLVSLALALALGLRLVRRLRQLANNARRLAGDEATTPLRGNDEIAELDRVYREMTGRISESIRMREVALAAYEREHEVATTLQRALLPDRLPSVPGLRIDTAYAPAGQGTAIGGDWYDVFPLEGSSVGISIGDVAGHGLRAATVMGEMRQSIRTAARIVTRPADVLRTVNRALCADEQGIFVTAFYGVFDRTTRTLRYALAGHPPPILVMEASQVRQTATGDGLLLGLDAEATFSEHAVTLDIGDGVVLFTDGIVEIDRDYLAGLQVLEAAVAAEVRDPSGNLATGIARRVFGTRSARDDAAVLYFGVTSLETGDQSQSMRTWEVDALDRVAVQRVKNELLRQLDEPAKVPESAFIEVIFGELVGNVARHTRGHATITLEQRDGEAILHVDDKGPPFTLDGRTLPNLTSENGRGIYLVRALSRSVWVERRSGGNRVSAVLPLAQRRDASSGSRSEVLETSR